ncbi:FAST kinase domain-containing protein 3, mitochondrial-like [Littorina saxatilis]
MSQPSLATVRVAVLKLTRAAARLSSAGHSTLTSTCTGLPTATCRVQSDPGKRHIHCSQHRLAPPSSRNVVSVSSILLQDGLEIQELPILIRLLDKGMVPLTNHTFSGERIRPMTTEDENFQYLLQQCESVRDVFKLLEIPAQRVTGYSASAALQRVSQLQKMNSDWDDLHSFIRTAVMRELNDTVGKDVAQLSNETLLELVSCYMTMESFEQSCMSAINGEIEKRMVEEQFSIDDLCNLSQLLRASPRGDRDLINSVWVYMGNHYRDVTETSLAKVLACLPPSHKYLLKVLGKQFHKIWWKMPAEQAVGCVASLVQLNSLQVSMMTDLAHWLFLNIHHLPEDGLMQFVAAFVHFRFSDSNFTTALERYIGARGADMNTNLLGLVMEYCRTRRFFSPTILDAAAKHFVQHGETYSALQLFTVLRPFGQLNYMPKDCHGFLLQSEKMLEKRFTDFHPDHLAELLCSFAFVDRVPLNFVQKVLTPTFFSKVKGLARPHEAGMWLEMLQSAVKLDSRGVRVPYLYKLQAGQAWKGERMKMLQSRLQETLDSMIGNSLVRMRTFGSNTVYAIDAEVHVNDRGQPIPVSYHGGQPSTYAAVRLAILILTADHYCVNSGHLLGEFSMRQRHLTKLGYTVVKVFDAEFLPLTRSERQKYMEKKWQRWIRTAKRSGT